MRQHLSFREHFRRGNAPLSRLCRAVTMRPGTDKQSFVPDPFRRAAIEGRVTRSEATKTPEPNGSAIASEILSYVRRSRNVLAFQNRFPLRAR